MKVLLGETLRGVKVELDLQQLATGRTFVCALSGGGKSHLARRVVEQIFGQVGLIVIDVEGEYASLRETFPFLIIGKDVPLTPEAAEFLADQTLDSELSVIIDGSDPNLDDATFQEFVQRFIDRFLAIETTKRKPYLFIAEEADELAPEHNFARSLCGPAIKKLAKKGRKRGVGIMVLTQRPAAVEKGVISQCRSKAIGQLDWDPDKEVVHKFARIPQDITNALDKFKRGDFYVSGDFVSKPGIVHVYPVQTKHVGETPEVVPPAPKALAGIVAALSAKLPSIIKEKLVPAVPRVAEIEARLTQKFEARWQTRLARVEKERDAIKARLEAKYETKIADLERRLEEAQKQAALAPGGVEDLLEHPLVKGRLTEKLSTQERSLVEVLEKKGPQTQEQLGLFLGVKPASARGTVAAVNKAMPGLVESVGGRYVSRLAHMFPVTEDAKEREALKQQVAELTKELARREEVIKMQTTELGIRTRDWVPKESMALKVDELEGQLHAAKEELRLTKAHPIQEPEGVQPSVPGQTIPVEATLHRTLTKFTVATNTETLDADESTVTGKLLAMGVRGFFSGAEPRGFGDIMAELERKYSVNRTSGGSRDTVRQSLEELVAKDILDRRKDQNQWAYFATDHFNERVRKP